jgi:nitrate/nitrite transporter NarK
MAGQLFGVGVLGRVMGIVLTADGVAEATAPMLVGYLRDSTGSYTSGFITLIATAVCGAIAIAALPQRAVSTCESSTAGSSSAVRAATSSR